MRDVVSLARKNVCSLSITPAHILHPYYLPIITQTMIRSQKPKITDITENVIHQQCQYQHRHSRRARGREREEISCLIRKSKVMQSKQRYERPVASLASPDICTQEEAQHKQ